MYSIQCKNLPFIPVCLFFYLYSPDHSSLTLCTEPRCWANFLVFLHTPVDDISARRTWPSRAHDMICVSPQFGRNLDCDKQTGSKTNLVNILYPITAVLLLLNIYLTKYPQSNLLQLLHPTNFDKNTSHVVSKFTWNTLLRCPLSKLSRGRFSAHFHTTMLRSSEPLASSVPAKKSNKPLYWSIHYELGLAKRYQTLLYNVLIYQW